MSRLGRQPKVLAFLSLFALALSELPLAGANLGSAVRRVKFSYPSLHLVHALDRLASVLCEHRAPPIRRWGI